MMRHYTAVVAGTLVLVVAAASAQRAAAQDTARRGIGDSVRALAHAQRDSANPKQLVKVKDEHNLMSQAAIGGDSAQHIALDTIGSGRVTTAELEREHDRLLYEIKVARTGRRGLEQVEVDAMTGQVVSIKHYGAARGVVKRANQQRKLNEAERKGDVKPEPKTETKPNP